MKHCIPLHWYPMNDLARIQKALEKDKEMSDSFSPIIPMNAAYEMKKIAYEWGQDENKDWQVVIYDTGYIYLEQKDII